MTEQLADHQQRSALGGGKNGEGMAQVVQPHLVQPGTGANAPPSLLKIDQMQFRQGADDDVRIAIDAWRRLQDQYRDLVQEDRLGAGFGLREENEPALEIDIVPFERGDLAEPGTA